MVAEDGKIAVRLYPIFICVPNDGFRRRAYDELFFELGCGVYHYSASIGVVFETIVRYYGALFGKTFNVLCFA